MAQRERKRMPRSNAPKRTALPETEEPERDEDKGKKDGHVAVKRSAERTQNVAAVKLATGRRLSEVAKADPGGAANRMEATGCREKCRDAAGQRRDATGAECEGQVDVTRIVKAGTIFAWRTPKASAGTPE